MGTWPQAYPEIRWVLDAEVAAVAFYESDPQYTTQGYCMGMDSYPAGIAKQPLTPALGWTIHTGLAIPINPGYGVPAKTMWDYLGPVSIYPCADRVAAPEIAATLLVFRLHP